MNAQESPSENHLLNSQFVELRRAARLELDYVTRSLTSHDVDRIYSEKLIWLHELSFHE